MPSFLRNFVTGKGERFASRADRLTRVPGRVGVEHKTLLQPRQLHLSRHRGQILLGQARGLAPRFRWQKPIVR